MYLRQIGISWYLWLLETWGNGWNCIKHTRGIIAYGSLVLELYVWHVTEHDQNQECTWMNPEV